MSEAQTDMQTFQSEPAVEAPAAEAVAQTEGAQVEAAVDADEATVLGGEVKDATEEVVEAPAGAPEKYELALEGFEMDGELLAEAEPLLRELNLSNEAANKLLPIVPKVMEKAQNAAIQSLIDAGAQQRKDWLDAFAADPEIGGAKREETEHLAAKGLDALGFTLTGHGEDGKQPHPFRKALNESGFGNHPDMIRIARRLGEMVSEDGGFIRSADGVQTKPKGWADRYSS